MVRTSWKPEGRTYYASDGTLVTTRAGAQTAKKSATRGRAKRRAKDAGTIAAIEPAIGKDAADTMRGALLAICDAMYKALGSKPKKPKGGRTQAAREMVGLMLDMDTPTLTAWRDLMVEAAKDEAIADAMVNAPSLFDAALEQVRAARG